MKCPYCEHLESKVLDSRTTEDGTTIRRRRKCMSCSSRFTTYERVEDPALLVIKKDERRERFDRQKVLSGILKACEKRPVGLEAIEEIVSKVEKYVKNNQEREISSMTVGTMVMGYLRELDHVAYVRFASVYKEFEDIRGFQRILEGLTDKKTMDSPTEEGEVEKAEITG
ncbi:MAG: transcriptional regulator NrdR [Candidatus Xenobiia bacterium LiM19]